MQQVQQESRSLPLPRITVAPLPEQPVAVTVLARLWDEAERAVAVRRPPPNPASSQAAAAEKSATVRYAYD